MHFFSCLKLSINLKPNKFNITEGDGEGRLDDKMREIRGGLDDKMREIRGG